MENNKQKLWIVEERSQPQRMEVRWKWKRLYCRRKKLQWTNSKSISKQWKLSDQSQWAVIWSLSQGVASHRLCLWLRSNVEQARRVNGFNLSHGGSSLGGRGFCLTRSEVTNMLSEGPSAALTSWQSGCTVSRSWRSWWMSSSFCTLTLTRELKRSWERETFTTTGRRRERDEKEKIEMSPQACLVNKPVCQLQGFRLEEIIFTSVKSPQQVAVMSCKEYRAANEGDPVSKVAKITSSMSFIHRCLTF